jgi:hypothetical protein
MKLGHLPRLIRGKPGTALLVRGGPGIGKTEVTTSELTDEGTPFRKFVAAQETPESVTGFLWVDQQDKSCSYFPQRRLSDLSKVWEADPKAKAVLVIDEFKGGDRMVHNALQQLVREHEVGDWVAKGQLYVIALTNREEDRANVTKLSAPMIGRLIQVTVDADFDFWRGWASSKGVPSGKVHTDIAAWLDAMFIGNMALKTDKGKEWAKSKDLLFCSPSPSDESPYPTPRSHEMASDVLTKFEGEDDDFLRETVAGAIGMGPAIELMAWRKVGKEASHFVEEVLNGKSVKGLDVGMTFFVNTQLTAKYAKDPTKTSGPIVKYLAESEAEYAFLMCHDLAKISGAVAKHKDWSKVREKHKDVSFAYNFKA